MANPLGMTTAQRERQQEGVLDLLLSIEMNAFVSTSGGASGHCEVGCKGEEKGGLSDVDKQYLWDIQDTIIFNWQGNINVWASGKRPEFGKGV